MTLCRAMAVFERVTAVPEDRVVNSFWFDSDSVPAEDNFPAIGNAVVDFYNGLGPNGIANFLSGQLKRTTDVSEVRIYNMTDPEPREPFIRKFTLGAGGSGSDLPSELAVCMSFYSVRSVPRQRGRLYIGPLKDLSLSSGTGDAQVSPQCRAAIWQAGERLIDAGTAENFSWVTHSTFGQTGDVTAGWVDNAFDVVRKRGMKATARDVFPQ